MYVFDAAQWTHIDAFSPPLPSSVAATSDATTTHPYIYIHLLCACVYVRSHFGCFNHVNTAHPISGRLLCAWMALRSSRVSHWRSVPSSPSAWAPTRRRAFAVSPCRRRRRRRCQPKMHACLLMHECVCVWVNVEQPDTHTHTHTHHLAVSELLLSCCCCCCCCCRTIRHTQSE